MTDTIDHAIRLALDDLVSCAPDLGVVPASRTTSRSRRFAIAGSALVAAAGIAAFALVESRQVPAATAPAALPSQPFTPATITVGSVEDDASVPPWDDVAIASGTVGWFQLGEIPAALAERVPKQEQWSAAYTSQFFQCAAWTEAGSTITCGELVGGNYIDQASYGTDVGVGVQLGAGLDPTHVLWQLAQGSLWGYDTVTAPPVPTQVPIGSVTGWSYRNDKDVAYLVWERSPGVIVWLKAEGFTDSDMAALASVTEPVDLPGALPILIPFGASVTDVNGTPRSLKFASVDGIGCAGITMYTECTRVDQGPALVRSLDGSAPTVAAIAPIGTAASLVVTLDDGEHIDLPLTDARLGLESAIYTPPAGAAMIEAVITAPDGVVLERLDLPSGPGPTTATTAMAGPISTDASDLVSVPGMSLSVSSASTTDSQTFAATVAGVFAAHGVAAERREDATRGLSSGADVQWSYFLETAAPRRLFVTVGPADELDPDYIAAARLGGTVLSDGHVQYAWPTQLGTTTAAIVTSSHTYIVRSEGVEPTDPSRPEADLVPLLSAIAATES